MQNRTGKKGIPVTWLDIRNLRVSRSCDAISFMCGKFTLRCVGTCYTKLGVNFVLFACVNKTDLFLLKNHKKQTFTDVRYCVVVARIEKWKMLFGVKRVKESININAHKNIYMFSSCMCTYFFIYVYRQWHWPYFGFLLHFCWLYCCVSRECFCGCCCCWLNITWRDKVMQLRALTLMRRRRRRWDS